MLRLLNFLRSFWLLGWALYSKGILAQNNEWNFSTCASRPTTGS